MGENIEFLVDAFIEGDNYGTGIFQDQRSDRFYKFYKLLLPLGTEVDQDFLRPYEAEGFTLIFCANYFDFVRLFFANFFNVSKGSPSLIFDILQQN